MKYKISVISGDGIGPEITKCSIDVMKSLEDKLNIEFELLEIEAGDSALKNNGIALSDEAIDKIKETDDMVLLIEKHKREIEELQNSLSIE